MKRNWKVWLVLTLVVCGTVPAALAGEHPGTPMGSRKATPASSSSTPTPQISSAEGSISAIDLQTNSLNLTTADGKIWTLALDPKTTLVWKGTEQAKLDNLKVGEKVKVRYVAKEGKQLARSVDINESSPTASSAPSAGK